ncbi:phosphotransferase family protein [Streptomyces sp. NPDC014864]|uniref:phosphotransferase family protein n=1 Tax=Streptomyces sp. NPDC014864 TaxID=3364924 RepID=UPI0036FB322F
MDQDHVVWRRGLFRAGPLGRRIGLRTTGGRDGVAAAHIIDRPSRPIGRAAASLDRLAARLSVGPRVPDPLAGVEPLIRTLLMEADGAAFVHSSMSGRCVAAISTGGRPHRVLKLGKADDHPLRNEAEFLEQIPGIRLPFKVPDLIYAGHLGDHYVVMTHAWQRSRLAGPLSPSELLNLTEALSRARVGDRSIVHGDLAPWNVLRTPQGIGLVDWEAATFADQPLRDLVHYLVQAGAHLRWMDVKTVVRELTHPAGTVASLAHRLGCRRSQVEEELHSYFTTYPPIRIPRVRRFRDRVALEVGITTPA